MTTKPRKTISVRYFHVVGGGCFGTQYTRWLFRAKSLGMVDFEKIIAIDHNSKCQLKNENFEVSQLEIIEADWIDYFSQYLLQSYQDSKASTDHWVPSPQTPHILFLGFMQAVKRLKPNLSFTTKTFGEKVPTPINIPLQNGTCAVSFAEWVCPVNCLEPNQCPAIHAPRTWDMKPNLEEYFANTEGQHSAHILQCTHLAHGVGSIPCADIFLEFNHFLERLEKENLKKLTLATVSRCHGIIGEADLQFQTKGQNSQ